MKAWNATAPTPIVKVVITARNHIFRSHQNNDQDKLKLVARPVLSNPAKCDESSEAVLHIPIIAYVILLWAHPY